MKLFTVIFSKRTILEDGSPELLDYFQTLIASESEVQAVLRVRVLYDRIYHFVLRAEAGDTRHLRQIKDLIPSVPFPEGD